MSTLNDLIKQFCSQGVEYVRLGDLCKITSGEFVNKNKQTTNGCYPVYNGGTSNTGFYDHYNTDSDKVIISARGAAGFVNHIREKFWAGNSCHVLNIFDNNLLTRYLYFILLKMTPYIISKRKEGTIPSVTKSSLETLEIPLPPLRVQEEIVKILDKFTDLENELENELRMRKMQFNAYRDKLLTFDNGVKFEKLGDLTTIHRGKRLTKKELYPNGIYNVYHGTVRIPLGRFDKFNVHGDAVIIVNTGSIGEIKYCKNNFWCSDGCFWLKSNDKLNNKFIYYYIKQFDVYFQSQKRPGGVPTIDREIVETLKIPVPPLEKQKETVEKLDKFNEMCNEISEGLPLEIELRKKQKNYILNKLLNI